MWEDPIVEEVRKYRREIDQECNNDFSLLFSKVKKIEKALKNRVVSRVHKKRIKKREHKNYFE